MSEVMGAKKWEVTVTNRWGPTSEVTIRRFVDEEAARYWARHESWGDPYTSAVVKDLRPIKEGTTT
jgi:hypothetical protein